MKVKFPPGFLKTLSEKTLKELREKANDFKYECELEGGYNYYRSPCDGEYYLQSDRGVAYQTAGQPIRVNGRTIITFVGFVIDEESLVSKNLQRVRELEAVEKELNELKKSIESIKNAFK